MKEFIQGLYKAIKELGKLESKVKPVLAQLSRDILTLHNSEGDQRHDVRVVNALLSQLSPGNKRIACLFFKAFLPYVFDDETKTFGKLRKKEAIVTEAYAAMTEFLANPDNNIWTWQAENVRMERQPVNLASKVTDAVTKALTAKSNAVTQAEVIQAVFAGGVTVDAIIEALKAMDAVNVVEEAEAA